MTPVALDLFVSLCRGQLSGAPAGRPGNTEVGEIPHRMSHACTLEVEQGHPAGWVDQVVRARVLRSHHRLVAEVVVLRHQVVERGSELEPERCRDLVVGPGGGFNLPSHGPA
jgi:hypothetical protein